MNNPIEEILNELKEEKIEREMYKDVDPEIVAEIEREEKLCDLLMDNGIDLQR